MTLYLNDLEDLKDILNDLVFEDEPSIFDENYALELIETALQLIDEFMEENPTIITEPDFYDILLEELQDYFYIQFEEDILRSDFVEDDLNELLEEAVKIYITSFYTERSINNEIIDNTNIITNKPDLNTNEILKQNILTRINCLKLKPQPPQRTEEWYKFRYNLITASNAYKAFESQAMINQLIYEKCQPLKSNLNENTEIKMVNTNTTLHWGQKYEPMSVLIYEDMYNTKIGDFGCIQHEIYPFIGASPDGINIDTNSDRFGRMLEIKNIVNREINGIPKKEYWVQMQLQMEVCDLDECDFLETKFVEYNNSIEFYEDVPENTEITDNHCKSKNDFLKGIIIYFNTKEAKPYYLYKPLNIIDYDSINNWEEESISLYQNEEHNMTYIKTIYWKLEKLSCVLVQRNKLWFKNNIGTLENIWKIIEQERITGFEHRAPNRKVRKDSFSENSDKNLSTNGSFTSTNGSFISTNGSGCLLSKFIVKKIISDDNITPTPSNT